MTDSEPNPDNIRSGPIRHDSLSDEVLEQVRSIFKIIGPYLETTLEQFEVTLMRDAAPEDEVVIWASITTAWMDYHKQHLDDELLPEADEKKLLAALIAISTGVEDVEALGVPVLQRIHHLSERNLTRRCKTPPATRSAHPASSIRPDAFCAPGC